MALKANRKAVGTEVAGGQEMEQTQTAPVNETQPTTQAQPPAMTQTAPPAPRGNNAMADLNAGILDNIDDMNIGGNYVTVDGESFLYKADNTTAKEIDIVVSYGKRFYQYVDESDPNNKQFYNSDTKLDDRYKLKFEIRWFEEGEEGEPVECILTLPTASAMSFLNYVKGLTKQGYGVGQVITRLSISRQHNKQANVRYSRVEFQNVGVAE